jgi:hypothetical protein
LIARHYDIGINSDSTFYLYKAYSKLKKQFKEIHDTMQENYNMCITKTQIPKDFKEWLESKDRTAYAYNLIAPILKSISSMERGSRKKVIAIPRTEEDNVFVEKFNYVLDHYKDKGKFDYYITRAHLDAIIAMYSFVFQYWGYDPETDEGKIFYTALNPMKAMFELNDTIDTSMSKCNYIMIESDLTVEEIIEMYALHNEELAKQIILQASNYIESRNISLKEFISENIRRIIDSAMDFFSASGYSTEPNYNIQKDKSLFDSNTGRFKVVEIHERRRDKRLFIRNYDDYEKYDITDNVKDENGRISNELIGRLRDTKFKNSSDPKPFMKTNNYIVANCPALEIMLQNDMYTERLPNNNFALTMIPAYDYSQDISKMQSVVSEIIDVQSDYNKSRNIIQDMLIRYIRKGYLVKENAIKEYMEDFEENKFYKRVKGGQGPIGDLIKEEEVPRVTPELIREGEESKHLMHVITNVTPSLEGRSEDSNQSGKKYIALREQSEKNLTMLFDNLNFSKIIIVENTAKLVQANVKEETVIRINEDLTDNYSFFKINQIIPVINPRGYLAYKKINDISKGNYDFKIANSPYGATAREREYAKEAEIFEIVMKLDAKLALKGLPLLLKSSDLGNRYDWVELIQKHLGEVDNVNPAMKQMMSIMQQLEIKGKELENNKKAVEIKKIMVDVLNKYQDLKKKSIENENYKNELAIESMLNNPYSFGSNGYRMVS